MLNASIGFEYVILPDRLGVKSYTFYLILIII